MSARFRVVRIEVDGINRAMAGLAQITGNLDKALARGINRTAAAVEQSLLNEMERTIDRPTPFTLNAIKVYPARERPNPNAMIKIQPMQARYLKWAVFGGTLPVIIEPISIRLNAYGNILGKARGLEGIAARGRNRFVATINGRLGVWERSRNRIKLLVQVGRQRERMPRFDFYGKSEEVARARLARDVNEALVDVIRGALG